MAPLLDDPALHTHTGGRPLLPHELEERYERQAKGRPEDGSARWFNWIVRERETGRAAGYVQASVDAGTGVADVAWVMGTGFQGRGYAREAAAAMVGWLCNEGVTAVTAHIHPDNERSKNVASAIGLSPTPTIRAGEVMWRGRCQGATP
jgi:RimJ/RimL family protein N-acetyltransferase